MRDITKENRLGRWMKFSVEYKKSSDIALVYLGFAISAHCDVEREGVFTNLKPLNFLQLNLPPFHVSHTSVNFYLSHLSWVCSRKHKEEVCRFSEEINSVFHKQINSTHSRYA